MHASNSSLNCTTPSSSTNRPSRAGNDALPLARSLSAPALCSGFTPSPVRTRLFVQVAPFPAASDATSPWKYNDSHFHPTQYTQQGRTPDTLIGDMDRLGIQYATLMPIPTNVLSSQPEPDWNPCSGAHHCGPSYYLPPRMLIHRTLSEDDMAEARQATELYMNTGVDATTAHRYRQLPRVHQKRLDPMITGLHLGDMHSSTYLLRKLHEHPGVFTGVGEITVHKEAVEELFAGTRQANLEGNVAPLLKLLETCGKVGMPVVLHCDVTVPGAAPDESPAYLEGIQRLFTDPSVAGTVIIWAHAGGLGRFVDAPANHTAALQAMLADSRFAHVHIDLSWSVVAERLVANKETLGQWVALVEAFPKRFIFGSDALAPVDAGRWNQTYAKYEELMQALTPACRQQVCLSNYHRLFVAARRKVRAFEQYILPGIIDDLQRSYARPASAPAGAFASSTAMMPVTSSALPSPEKQRQ